MSRPKLKAFKKKTEFEERKKFWQGHNYSEGRYLDCMKDLDGLGCDDAMTSHA